MFIKICGLADPESIRQIAELHPSMMGFIFYAFSPRNACALLPSAVDAIPSDIERVGVFVNTPVEHILRTAARYGLTAVQLHGNESPETCDALRKSGFKVMKAIGIGDNIDWENLRRYEGTIDRFVFDTATDYHGGSGRKFDWTLLRGYPLATPFLLRGGITPDDGGGRHQQPFRDPSRIQISPTCQSLYGGTLIIQDIFHHIHRFIFRTYLTP